MRFTHFVAGGILAATLALASAAQAEVMFLKVTGQKSGAIKGGVTQKGHEGGIKVLAYGERVSSTRDPQSGLPTGKRTHEPLTFVTDLDQSSPKLFNALVNNENLSDVSLEIWAPDPRTGTQTLQMTVQLVNASLASYAQGVQEGATSGYGGQGNMAIQEVSFTYQRIIITYSDGKVVGMEDWGAPLTSKTLAGARPLLVKPLVRPAIPPKP